MTQDDYKLYTGQAVSFTDTEWSALVTIAQMRLASFLCLDAFPELDESNTDLAMLLANFMAGIFKHQGDDDTIDSKSVRNFTIRFKSSSTANAFSQISQQYGDIIEKYSQCKLGFAVERSKRCCCGYPYGF